MDSETCSGRKQSFRKGWAFLYMFDFLLKHAVVDTDDTGLRTFTHERMKVFAKFTAKDCLVCKMLGPAFGQLAEAGARQNILFLRLNSNENPVARQLMNERAAPFFVSYCQGRISECNTCETEAEMMAQFERLQHLMPQTA